MTLLHGFETPASHRGGFVSIGNFDGVHRGHQDLLAALVNRARANHVPAVVLTFDKHPLDLLRPGEAPPRLTSTTRRAELLQKFGVDCVITLTMTPELLKMTAVDFFQTIVRTEIQASGLVEGPDFCFGRNRVGNIKLLQHFCKSHDLSLDVIPQFVVNEQRVSSSAIRKLVDAGDLTTAAQLLGHPYRISGVVDSYDEEGGGYWCPSATLVDLANLVPGNGVYAGTAIVGNRRLGARINVGEDLTSRSSSKSVVVHLSDRAGDLRGKRLEIEILYRTRQLSTLASVDESRLHLPRDIEEILGHKILPSKSNHALIG